MDLNNKNLSPDLNQLTYNNDISAGLGIDTDEPFENNSTSETEYTFMNLGGFNYGTNVNLRQNVPDNSIQLINNHTADFGVDGGGPDQNESVESIHFRRYNCTTNDEVANRSTSETKYSLMSLGGFNYCTNLNLPHNGPDNSVQLINNNTADLGINAKGPDENQPIGSIHSRSSSTAYIVDRNAMENESLSSLQLINVNGYCDTEAGPSASTIIPVSNNVSNINSNNDDNDNSISDDSMNDSTESISSDITEAVEEATVQYEGRPKRGRKRKFKNQSRADRKKLSNNNNTHFNTKGDVTMEKVFDEEFVCLCSKRCTEVVSSDLRKRLFRQFMSMGTFEGRSALITGCVTEMVKKRTYTKSVSKRSMTRKYSIYGQQVCKIALLKTLQINQCRIDLALQKQCTDSYKDGRGTLSGGRNALSLLKKEEVRAHIQSFPRYVSHYCRNTTEAKFLSPILNLAKMYDLYLDKRENPVSLSYYRRIFYDDFNLRFKTLQKDTCLKCDQFAINIRGTTGETLRQLETAQKAHWENAANFRNEMNNDLQRARDDIHVETLTFDMQKTHALPYVSTNIAYYKRQLNVYNLGIHVGSTGKGIFNIWQENEASKGTQEVGSSLRKYIMENIKEPVKTLILWSDSCGGQNRSIKLVLMLIHILQSHSSLETIITRYLQPGHSFLPNDSEFGDVETAIKEPVYTINGYIKTMNECRRENKFKVNRLTSQDFFSVSKLEKATINRKCDINKDKINWFKTHEIMIQKSYPTLINMRKGIGENYQTVSIERSQKGQTTDFKTIELEQLWPSGKPLSKEKIKDLKELLSLVPEEDRQFYSFLDNITEGDFIDDVDGFGEAIDFEAEVDD